MNNLTNVRIPKKYEERVGTLDKDVDGYWLVLNVGWTSYNGNNHMIHEWNQNDLLRELRKTEICKCEECKKER